MCPAIRWRFGSSSRSLIQSIIGPTNPSVYGLGFDFLDWESNGSQAVTDGVRPRATSNVGVLDLEPSDESVKIGPTSLHPQTDGLSNPPSARLLPLPTQDQLIQWIILESTGKLDVQIEFHIKTSVLDLEPLDELVKIGPTSLHLQTDGLSDTPSVRLLPLPAQDQLIQWIILGVSVSDLELFVRSKIGPTSLHIGPSLESTGKLDKIGPTSLHPQTGLSDPPSNLLERWMCKIEFHIRTGIQWLPRCDQRCVSDLEPDDRLDPPSVQLLPLHPNLLESWMLDVQIEFHIRTGNQMAPKV
ncbi:hypothetical protein Acr_10g0005940 [Actinidia rufa]|uniref:Uncharacterized protein n=1 Tax=Actinidia rufa TaxID=165716 RepID=A0A7J0FAG8_9ERIC|nr:hypothetical protein Acr_10g0005940 [Actinidia rufa]